MKVFHTPLTEAETLELGQLLADCGGASLDFAHGVFAAVASAPTRKDITDWLPLIVGGELPDKAALERLFALLMRDFHASSQCLALGVPAVPKPQDRDAITRYCKGYVRVTQSDARWKADLDAFALTMPFAVLSGYVAPESLAALQPELAADPEAWCEKQRTDLPDMVARVYAYWCAARTARDAKVTPVINVGSRVGRNDPCPCRSGKKFKRCCGMS